MGKSRSRLRRANLPWGDEWKPDLCNSQESKLNSPCSIRQFHPTAIAAMALPIWPAMYKNGVSRSLARILMIQRWPGGIGKRPGRPKPDAAIHETGCVADPQRVEASSASKWCAAAPGASPSTRADALIVVGCANAS